MKAIILAGGAGTRLYPLTVSVNKQLLPVYDKPMIYYSLSTVMLAGLKDILIITCEEDLPLYERLFGSGGRLGISIQYAVQPQPRGIPEAFLIGADFIGSDSVCLILGDNIFFGYAFSDTLKAAASLQTGALVFGYRVSEPRRYGVVEFDRNYRVISIEEKPETPKSDYAVPGLYFFDNTVIRKARGLSPSRRGELEIIDILKAYLSEEALRLDLLGRGFAWLDTGTHESLQQAGAFVETLEKRQGLKIGCVEEVALRRGFISLSAFTELIQDLPPNAYRDYLSSLSVLPEFTAPEPA